MFEAPSTDSRGASPPYAPPLPDRPRPEGVSLRMPGRSTMTGPTAPRHPRSIGGHRLSDRLAAPVLVQAPVVPAGGEQLGVRALLDDPAVLEHDDLAGALDRREPVGDHDRRPAGEQAAQASLDLGLAVDVDVRGRLVEDEDARVGDERAGKRHELALPGR